MKPLPIDSYELVEELDRLYPEKSPNPLDSEREIWMKAGERRLVNNLLIRKKVGEKTEYSTKA
jgi:hypothetical protein